MEELRPTKLSSTPQETLQGAMQGCDLDRHSVKGPGVDATYHVPYAEALVSSCNVNVLSKLVPT